MTTPTGTRFDSPWSASVFHTTAPDVTAPPQPSAPQVARDGTTARVRWDGLGVFGVPMPADLEAVEAHLSASASYDPTSPADREAPGFSLAADTFRADLQSGAVATIPGLTVNTTYYVVFIARDKSGNRSEPTAPVAV
jgi:hypothetical protein